jgi:hypothetical protein
MVKKKNADHCGWMVEHDNFCCKLAITAISVIVDPRLGALALLHFGTAPHTNKWDVHALIKRSQCAMRHPPALLAAIRVSR